MNDRMMQSGYYNQKPQQQQYPSSQQPPSRQQKHQDEEEDSPQNKQNQNFDGVEIVKQGYGISQPMRQDILNIFQASLIQTEYKNPADYMKLKLDQKFGPFWFIFMWEDKKQNNAQYSYYNNDDRVIEFKANGWKVLVYSFNQMTYPEDRILQPPYPSIEAPFIPPPPPPPPPPTYYLQQPPPPEYYYYDDYPRQYFPQSSGYRAENYYRPRWYYY